MVVSHQSNSCFAVFFLFGLLAGACACPLNPLSEHRISFLSDTLVNVTLYEEALCPDCAEFITGPVAQLFTNGLSEVTRLTIIPYGNAKEIDGKIYCQHGPDECLLDRIEACVIDAYPETNSWFSFISCVEQQPRAARVELWPQCGVALGLDVIGIQNCAQGKKGDELEAKNRELTASLDPPHRFVPWVTIDGVPLYEDLDSFFKRVCEAYKGAKKLDVCNSFHRADSVFKPF